MEYFSLKCQTHLRSRQLHNSRRAAGRIPRSNFWANVLAIQASEEWTKIFLGL